MYLKALEIQGFKSFPDKTVLNFGEALTAIVGPNGSGKSNIADAIRWVMGEQSAKGLRGAKMEDVIFGGSEKRKRLGFAQVTLVLDNTAHIFPSMEESEVSVARRYYRSGESEYYINRQNVRLRDLTELFMDTGLGREGYSIISQGKIDEILSVKSGERREVFEEAAGISKFRHRKEDAQRKLERTEENLIRINDRIAELELQVKPLQSQAETAKQYLLFQEEIRSLEISVWLEQLDTLKMDTRKLEVDCHALQQKRDETHSKLDKLYAEIEQYGEHMRQKDLEIEQRRTESMSLEKSRQEQEAAIAVLESDIAHQRENAERIKSELEDTSNRAEELEQQARKQESHADELSQEIQTQNLTLEKFVESIQETTHQSEDIRSEVLDLQERENAALSIIRDVQTEIAAATAENNHFKERQATLLSEQEKIKAQLSTLETEIAENHHALEEIQDKMLSADNIIAGHKLRVEQREKKRAVLSEDKVQLTMQVSALENRIHFLNEMKQDYEGFSRAVKMIMQAGKRLHGIHQPAANLMKIDAKYSLAIETAMGAALQFIVVEQEEDAKNAITFLQQRNAGRATFLPISVIRGGELMNLEPVSGLIGIASHLIQFDEQYRGIFQNLLGRTVIVEDLDCGITISRKYRAAFRVVTLTGQVINRGGSMTGGSTSKNTGILSRSAELDVLQKQIIIARQKVSTAVESESHVVRELSTFRRNLEIEEEKRRQLENEKLRLIGLQEHLSFFFESLKENQEHTITELHSLAERIEENQRRRDINNQQIAEQESMAKSFHSQLEKILARQSKLLEKSGELSDEIGAKKEQIAALTAERSLAMRRAADLRRLAEELSSNRAEREKNFRIHQENMQISLEKIEHCRNMVRVLTAQSNALQSQITALVQEKSDLEAQRTVHNRESQDINEKLLYLEREVTRLEQSISAKATEEKQILNRLWENYALSHSAAQEQRIEIQSVAKTLRRISELKKKINALGSVNLGAIEEFERVNTRYIYFTEQRSDIEKAKYDLEMIIAKITEQMTYIFSQQFQLLSDSFQTTFSELFGGGEARLELEDEKDILNCGIEIKAQPPGKTLKTISLLSGGEKAFVAIALYFSILKVHPTPFCVMDEIEAALDDVNVTRYARYMRTLTGKTQFIVITHRRGTMEEADILYGVTMQEQGVSKVVTINLNDISRKLKLK